MAAKSKANMLFHIRKKNQPQEIERVNRMYKRVKKHHTIDTTEWNDSENVCSSNNDGWNECENVYGSNNDFENAYNQIVSGNVYNDNSDHEIDNEIIQPINEDYNYESDNDIKSDVMPSSIAINANVSNITSADDNNTHSNNSNYIKLLGMLPRVYDIDIVSMSINKIMSVLDRVPPNDSNDIILDQSNLSKTDVSKLIHGFSINAKLTKKCQSELLGLLNTMLPDINWPSTINANNNKVISRVANYVQEDYRILSFDICPKPNHNCLVFIGDYANDFSCKICSSNRYSKCSKCHLFECSHPNRVPIQRVYYRPLTLLVYDLLKYDVAFLNLINYECKEYDKYEVSDVRNGENFKRHMKEMKINFENYQYEFDKECKMVNLCISQFYDGTMTRKTKVQNFWPLLITILNFPPDVRNKLGIGTFLMSIYTAGSNTPAERFVLEYCFSKELEQLYTGVYLKTNNGGFYVQIRLISTVLDTIGFQDILHVTGANSYDGCFFCMGSMGKGTNLCNGLQGKPTPRMGYIQSRAGLPYRNQLRECGQSKKCCPRGYYKRHYKNEYANKKLPVKDDDRYFGYMNYSKTSKDLFSKSFPCLSEDKDIDFLYNYLSGKDAVNTWEKYHEDYNHAEFQQYLFFNHCCYVPYEEYKRKCNVDYYEDALIYFSQEGKKEPINGVKGVHHMFRLPYVRFDLDFVYDGFHAIMNLATNIIQNWKGERAYLNDYHLQTSTHFNLNIYKIDDKTQRMFWFLSNQERYTIESIINEILIPVGLSNEFQLTHLFTRTDQLRGIAKIQIVTVCMKMIVSIAKFPIPYKKFYVWLSEDINSLLSPVFKSLNDIDILYFRILEIMVLYQGLFPDTESKFINHQIICIIMHLKISGSLRNTWTIPGERALSTVKDFVPDGGRSFDLQTIKNYSASEKQTTDEFFSKQSLDKYTFSDESFKLDKQHQQNNTFSIPSNDIDSLLYLLVNEIKKRSKDIKEANGFTLFKLYRIYIDSTKKIKKSTKGVAVVIQSFYDFIVADNDQLLEFKDYIISIVNFFNKEFIFVKYSKAIVYGIEMDSLSTSSKHISNNSNLKENWHKERSFSSWFKLRSCNYDRNELLDDKESSFMHKNDNKKKYLYGQFNYFFNLKPTFEPTLNNVLVASVLIRQHKKSEYIIDKISIDQPVDGLLKYVSLTDVYSTRIMTCGVSEDNTAIRNPNKHDTSNISKTSSTFVKEKEFLTHLMMFTLNSDRDNIKENYELN